MFAIGVGTVFGLKEERIAHEDKYPHWIRLAHKMAPKLRKFTYSFDNPLDNLDFDTLFPEGYKIVGCTFTGIVYVEIEAPKNVEKYAALLKLGNALEANDPYYNSEAYRFLKGDIQEYPVCLSIFTGNHKNDLKLPEETIKSCSGDCDDFATLITAGINGLGEVGCFVSIPGHAVAAVTEDHPNSLQDLKGKVLSSNGLILGSSEYVHHKDKPVPQILEEVNEKFLVSSTNALVTTERVFCRQDLKKSLEWYGNLYVKLQEGRAKAAADLLGVNEEELADWREEYCRFYGNILKKLSGKLKENEMEYLKTVREYISDEEQQKVARDYLFTQA